MSEETILGLENLSLRSYQFPLEQVPVLHWDNDRAKIMTLIKDKSPVVIKGSNIAKSALGWNLDYLKQNLGNAKHNVWLSKTNRFKYWNDTTAKQLEDQIKFVAPTRRLDMTISEFSNRLET